MSVLDGCCATVVLPNGNNQIQVITAQEAHRDTAIEKTASVVPEHYASEQRVARALSRLGKHAAAQVIKEKLPTTKSIRSGDLGEIYATEWIDAHSGGYKAPIKRLRWKDHRNMAMRGEDVIGIYQDPNTMRLSFLKTEAKSRASLSTAVVEGARAGLAKDAELPSAHALYFVADRLMESGQVELSDAIDDALLKHGIPIQTVRHLLFTVSGNNPQNFLQNDQAAYVGPVSQWAVGLHVASHVEFVAAVFDKVIENADNN